MPPERGVGVTACAPRPEAEPAEPDAPADEAPTLANTESRRTESKWPDEHSARSLDSLIGRRRSKVSSQARQRYS